MKAINTTILMLGVVFVLRPASAQDVTKNPDMVRFAVQQICPVSGGKLGEHGPAVKAKIGAEEVFLCCRACLNGEVRPELWAAIHQNMAAAQGDCPVMEHKLPKQPKWTIANGRLLFVCCPPCIEDIAADPDKFIKKVDALYAISLAKE
jgi:hypothetical protein